MKMVSFCIFCFVVCICWARGSVSSLNNVVQSESVAMFETVKKIIHEISDIHIELETENQELKNIVFQLQIELTELKATCIAPKEKLTTAKATGATARTATTITTPEVTPATASTTTHAEITTNMYQPKCDDGWKYYGGHCYLFEGEVKTWAYALTNCREKNSYLIEISTNAELDFITEQSKYYHYVDFWTGAHSNGQHPGTFVYEHSNQQVPKEFWRPGQPDNDSGDQHCVYRGRYYDDMEFCDGSCLWYFHSVCEKPAI